MLNNIIVLLLALVLGMLGLRNLPQTSDAVNQSVDDKGDAVGETEKVLTNIHAVEVLVMEIHPVQVRLEVTGEHPDGCDLPVQVAQRRDGNSIEIEVYRELPTDMMCPMILLPYSDSIYLDGNFEGGSYTISVNSHSQSFDI